MFLAFGRMSSKSTYCNCTSKRTSKSCTCFVGALQFHPCFPFPHSGLYVFLWIHYCFVSLGQEKAQGLISEKFICLADMVLINNEGVFVDKGFCTCSLGGKGGSEHRRAATPEMFS